VALTETTILASVELLPQSNSINVRWDKLIQRDDEIVSRIPHRKAYGHAQRDEFAEEVDGAAKYLAAMGW